MRHLLLMLQHADSAFPSGSFAFSHGVEGLLALSALDRPGLAAALATLIRHRWATADRVALVHAHRAAGDSSRIRRIDHVVEAATLVHAIRAGSRRNGRALLAAHVRLGTQGAAELSQDIEVGRSLGHLPVVQGSMWRAIGLSEADAVAISGYTTAAGLVAAAVRLGVVGAIEGQSVLASVLAVVADQVVLPVRDEEPLASFVPLLDLAAARHERASLRLFAS